MCKKTILISVCSIIVAGILSWVLLSEPAGSVFDIPVDIVFSINTEKVLNEIDERIYSQFLEHICHSVDGGLYAELIRNRSFEEMTGKGLWFGDNIISQFTYDPSATLLIGDTTWTDYELTFSTRNFDYGGITAIVRAADSENYSVCIFRNNFTMDFLTFCDSDTIYRRLNIPCRFEYFNWHDIRVRCSGDSITVWCNEEEITKLNNISGELTYGMVGLQTMEAAAKFRNIRVEDPDGEILFSGVPELPIPNEETEFTDWEYYGDGKVIPSYTDPLNSNFCAVVVSGETETGLLQHNISIDAGETYIGSVWIKKFNDSGRITVRLLNGAEILDEVTLSVSDENWTECLFNLIPDVSSDSASLQIGFEEAGEVWLDQVSLIPETWAANGNLRIDLTEAIEEIHPTLIRWPGGAFASFYNWKDGIGPQYERSVYPRPRFDGMDVNAFGTDEFIELCDRVGAEPVLVINAGQYTPDERCAFVRNACDWLEYCNGPSTSHWGSVRAANGHPEPYNVRYWEIDNEVWDIGIEEYGNIIHEFVGQLKDIDPNIEIIACGGDFEWNENLLNYAGGMIDYLSQHRYENPDNFATAPVLQEKFVIGMNRLIQDLSGVNVELFYSEWNADSTDWRTGLHAAGMLNMFERNGNIVKMASPALFLRHLESTPWDNALINFDNTSWFPAPNYVVMKLWRESYAPHRLHINAHEDIIDAVATSSEDGETVYLKMINTGDALITAGIKLPDSAVEFSNAELSLIAPGYLYAQNTLDNPDAVSIETNSARIDGNYCVIELPALSVGVLEITK